MHITFLFNTTCPSYLYSNHLTNLFLVSHLHPSCILFHLYTYPSHPETSSLPVHWLNSHSFIHRRSCCWRWFDFSICGQESDHRKLSHWWGWVLFNMGHHFFSTKALQPWIRANGSHPREILLHELQPIQCFGIWHSSQQLVEDSSSNEKIYPVPKLGGE